MTQAIRLVVIDDHPLFREGVTRSLTEVGGFEVVGEGSRPKTRCAWRAR